MEDIITEKHIHRAYVRSDLATAVPYFLDNCRTELEVLEHAIEKQDFAAIESIGDRLVRTSGNYGFFLLGHFGSLLCQAAHRATQQPVRIFLQLIRRHLDALEVIYV